MNNPAAVQDVDEVTTEIPWDVAESIASWRRILGNTTGDKRPNLERAAAELWQLSNQFADDPLVQQTVVDSLHAMSVIANIDADESQAIMAEARNAAANAADTSLQKGNGNSGPQTETPTVKDYTAGVPLHIDEWQARDLPPADCLMGHWLTTTSRAILNATTGLGKTNFGMAIGGHLSAGVDFLHWHVSRRCRVLFIDGEMSRRLLQQRANDVVRRLPIHPDGLHLLSREDVPDFQPFNTEIGRIIMNQFIAKIGSVDMVIFDNVMSLTAGGMKDEEVWQETLPLINDLTRRRIGQLWIHHTGHDTTRGYGTSTREWQMDTVLQGNMAEHPETDVCFNNEFQKARERTPQTRRDFENVTIALVNDQWVSSAAKVAAKPASPLGAKFLLALQEVFASGETIPFGKWKAVKVEQWRMECQRLGLTEKNDDHAARRTFSKYKLELISRNYIACNNDLVWIIRGNE